MSGALDQFIRSGGEIKLEEKTNNGTYRYAAECTFERQYISSHYGVSVAKVLDMVESYLAEFAVDALRRSRRKDR